MQIRKNPVKLTFPDLNNVILFGGSKLLIKSAELIQELGINVVIASAPRHIDEVFDNNSIRSFAVDNGIPYFVVDDINTATSIQDYISPKSLGLAFGAAWVFEKKFVKQFTEGMLIDLMVIDLPQYRGGAHHTWQILHGVQKGCINLQVIEGGKETFHQGRILLNKVFEIRHSNPDPHIYFNCYENESMALLKIFFDKVSNRETFICSVIDESESLYFPFLFTPKHGWINWSWTSHEIVSFINAFGKPYRGAATFLFDQPVVCNRASVVRIGTTFHPFTAGIIVRKEKDIIVAVKDGLIKIECLLTEEGQSAMGKAELGARLYTPQKHIEESMQFQAVYSPSGLSDD